jgi:1,4-dihydroxy-6-naphthoate synthase
LGDWWENTMKAAIPLGGIVMKRTIDPAIIAQVDDLIKESVLYAWKHYPVLSEFVQCHAQEMDESVMRQHIQLYVNEYTSELGAVGLHSIKTLFAKAQESGLINEVEKIEQIFY